jgi:hypothetical protein
MVPISSSPLFCEAAGVCDQAERVAFRALRLDG